MREMASGQRDRVGVISVGGGVFNNLGFWLFVLLLFQVLGLYWGLWEIQNHYTVRTRPFTPYTSDSDTLFRPWVEEEEELAALGAPAVEDAPSRPAPGPAPEAEQWAVAPSPDVLPAITRSESERVVIEATTVELPFEVAEGVTTDAFTFNGHIPAPFYRLRVGDTVEYHLTNDENNIEDHSTDFHWVTGPGGGVAVNEVAPGEESVSQFKALKPGLYIYHCASGDIPMHIASGMYGLVLVEPEAGLPPVDREYWVMQQEWYLAGSEPGHWEMARQQAEVEEATFVVFNGSVGSLTGDNALKAKVGETVRLYVGNIGPNYTSSFHLIGEIFDRVYEYGTFSTPPLEDVQTVLIPAGGTVVVEVTFDVPGTYTFVDHAIFRLDKGAAGQIVVEGPEAPEIYSELQ